MIKKIAGIASRQGSFTSQTWGRRADTVVPRTTLISIQHVNNMGMIQRTWSMHPFTFAPLQGIVGQESSKPRQQLRPTQLQPLLWRMKTISATMPYCSTLRPAQETCSRSLSMRHQKALSSTTPTEHPSTRPLEEASSMKLRASQSILPSPTTSTSQSSTSLIRLAPLSSTLGTQITSQQSLTAQKIFSS